MNDELVRRLRERTKPISGEPDTLCTAAADCIAELQNGFNGELKAAMLIIKKQFARIAQLETALKQYGRHPASCSHAIAYDVACDCGLEAALNGKLKIIESNPYAAGFEAGARAMQNAAVNLCAEVVTFPAGHNGQWEGYGPQKCTRSGDACAAAIRALPLPKLPA